MRARTSLVLVALVLGVAGCSSTPRARAHDGDPVKVFVTVAAVGTMVEVETVYASGRATTLSQIDSDEDSRILQRPRVRANMNEPARIVVGDAVWRTVGVDSKGELREEEHLHDGFIHEVVCSPAGAGTVRLKLRAYVVRDGKVRDRGVHDVIVRYGEPRQLALEKLGD